VGNASLAQILAQSAKCRSYIKGHQWDEATECWGELESVVGSVRVSCLPVPLHLQSTSHCMHRTRTVSTGTMFYNVAVRIKKQTGCRRPVSLVRLSDNLLHLYIEPTLERLFLQHVQWARNSDPLDQLMNGQMKTKLNIPTNVTWGGMWC
jgi:hypothetical protein